MIKNELKKASTKKLYTIREIDERFNERMLSIVEGAPIESSGLKIIFDRHPNIFALPTLRSKSLRCAGFFIRDQLCGFAMMLSKEAFIKGKTERILYFGNLALDRSARGKGVLYRLSDLLLHDVANETIGYAIVMHGNTAAANLVARHHHRYPNMPYSKFIGQWQAMNILLTFKKKDKSNYTVRQARMEDIDEIIRLLQNEYRTRLFAPIITKEKFLFDLDRYPNFGIQNYYIAELGTEIIGVCCAWDMMALKRNRVLHYGGSFTLVKTLYKLLTPIFRFPQLPAEGELFRDVTITDYAVKDRNPDILRALLLEIYVNYRKKKYHMIIFGCPVNDPIQAAIKPFLSQPVISNIVLFSKSQDIVDEFEDASFPFVDMALL